MGDKAHGVPPNIAIRNIRTRKPSEGLFATTELEGVILGIVWSRQPCSPYVVLGRFRASPTWGWSSSTGAIYPAIRRLKGRGLLRHRPDAASARKAELLSLTRAGVAALQEWIRSLADEMGSAGIDPIRTRINYLAALPAAEREAFLDRAEELTRIGLGLVAGAQPDPAAVDNWTLRATNLGLRMQLEARLQWLAEVRRLARDA